MINSIKMSPEEKTQWQNIDNTLLDGPTKDLVCLLAFNEAIPGIDDDDILVDYHGSLTKLDIEDIKTTLRVLTLILETEITY